GSESDSDAVVDRRQAQAAGHAAGVGPRAHRQEPGAARAPRNPGHAGQGRPSRHRGELGVIHPHDLKPAPGSHRQRKRVGRGIGGKGGKTAGRGMKGQGARSSVKPWFEGGQLPLTQRVPKLKGFKNPFRVEYAVVNLDTLATYEGDEVSPDTLR